MNRRTFLGALLGGIAGLLVPLPKSTPKVVVPTFEIATNPSININEIKARRFYIVDRAQQNAKEAIQEEEDDNIFRTLRRAA